MILQVKIIFFKKDKWINEIERVKKKKKNAHTWAGKESVVSHNL